MLLEAAAFDGFDAAQDAVWMAEVAQESTHVWSSQPRITIFLSAMRHFAQALRDAGLPLAGSLQAAITQHLPKAMLAYIERNALDAQRKLPTSPAPDGHRRVRALARRAAEAGARVVPWKNQACLPVEEGARIAERAAAIRRGEVGHGA